MTVTYFDRQDERSILNGSQLQSANEIQTVLQKPLDREPFFCELVGENAKNLLIGLSADSGCVQYRAAGGSPLSLMAVERSPQKQGGHTDYRMGGATVPISNRYRLPLSLLLETAAFFRRTGGLNPNVTWEEA